MIKVDGKIRRDPRFPLGMMDVVTIEKTNENFRMLLDTKGRFLPHRIDNKESGFKLCKVIRKRIGKEKVPHIATHDGRTIRYPHPDLQINDCVKINLSNNEIAGIVKFQNNAIVMITGGNNIGRIGHLQSMEKHPGSFEIAHIRDETGNIFATRLGNVMVIGDSKEPVISLPKGRGVKLSLIEERAVRLGHEEASEDAEEDED